MPTGKLWELAAIPDMPSEPTLRAFIRQRADFPVIESGRKGVAYVFDLDVAAAFVREHWQDSRSEFSGVARATRATRAVGVAPQQCTLPGLFDEGELDGVTR